MFEKLQALYGGRGLLGACRDYGFSDMGVFLDWGSLHQKDPELFDSSETPEAQPEAERAAFAADLKAGRRFYGGERYEQSRSEEDKQAFGRGLKQTIRVAHTPREAGVRNYVSFRQRCVSYDR